MEEVIHSGTWYVPGTTNTLLSLNKRQITMYINIILMNTTYIGLEELRKHLSRVTYKAGKQKRRYIVMRKNQPIFELRPLSKRDAAAESLHASIERAEADIKAGRVYTLDQTKKKLGL